MSDKILWMEGMALAPQHFQQAELLAETAVQQRLQLVSPLFFGLASLEIDTDPLSNGYFALRECSGIFPDGTVFSFPHQDASLEQRPFEEFFSAERDSLSVYLAIPTLSRAGGNLLGSDSESRPLRFRSALKQAADLNSGTNTRQVELGQLNLRILFEGEALEGFQTLRICELVRDAQGRVQVGSGYVPPCLHIRASASLMRRLRRLTENCIQKSNFLMGQRAQKTTGVAKFTAESITSYLLLNAINTHLPELLHYSNHPQVHAEQLFTKLSTMAGALLAFGNQSKVSDLPKYAHTDSRTSFLPLFKLIDELLNASVPTSYVNFPLIKTSPIQYMGNMRDHNLAELTQFYLGVTAQASEVEVLNLVQRHAKVGPVARIGQIVNAALPGISLVPENNPPSSIPAKAGFKYFRLQQTGELWEQVLSAKSVAIHMPSNVAGTRLELVATRE